MTYARAQHCRPVRYATTMHGEYTSAFRVASMFELLLAVFQSLIQTMCYAISISPPPTTIKRCMLAMLVSHQWQVTYCTFMSKNRRHPSSHTRQIHQALLGPQPKSSTEFWCSSSWALRFKIVLDILFEGYCPESVWLYASMVAMSSQYPLISLRIVVSECVSPLSSYSNTCTSHQDYCTQENRNLSSKKC